MLVTRILHFLGFLVILSNAGAHLHDNLEQQVGETCSQDPVYVISSFDMSPYPPGIGVTFSIVMQGTFNNAAEVGQIQVGLKNNNR